MIRLARSLADLPPYLFAGLNRRAEEEAARGVDVINVAAGDPDLPPLPHVVEALERAIRDPAEHRYPPYAGIGALREAGARHYRRRYGVQLDPEREVVVLIGAKEGLAHAAHALLDAGDVALVPDPGYPVYPNQTRLRGAVPRSLPLERQAGWLPDFERVDPTGARALFLNYPNNPTGASCGLDHMAAAVAFCREHGMALVHDLAYGEIVFDGREAPSVLQVPGATDLAVEIMSLSKTYRMQGMRIGLAVGNAAIVGAIRTLKSHADTGQFRAIQAAAVAALEGPHDHLEGDRRLYQRRRDVVVAGLRRAGLDPDVPGGALYIWARLPAGWESQAFAEAALDRAGVLLAPGTGYGGAGAGYVRLALTAPEARLAEAVERLGRFRELAGSPV